jgi:hypothetical protein
MTPTEQFCFFLYSLNTEKKEPHFKTSLQDFSSLYFKGLRRHMEGF